MGNEPARVLRLIYAFLEDDFCVSVRVDMTDTCTSHNFDNNSLPDISYHNRSIQLNQVVF